MDAPKDTNGTIRLDLNGTFIKEDANKQLYYPKTLPRAAAKNIDDILDMDFGMALSGHVV